MTDGSPLLPDAVLDRQRNSWLSGNPSTVGELLRSGPYENDREAWLDLLYNEIVIQEELGLDPSLESYIARYPELADDLRLHFEVHHAFRESSSLLDTPDLGHDDSWPEVRAEVIPDHAELADYELVRVLGHGGMATVYLARHRRLHRDVALKMFKAGRDLTDRERFRIRTEAEAMARLAHPNIVHIFEIGDIGGAPYLALEFAEQGTLAQKLQRMPLAPFAAAELIESLARALHTAHQRHILHRDLKPANILFDHGGIPKIADFGLAKVLQNSEISSVEATRTGETLGTPRYMAPEQAAGKPELVGTATDIYALGNLLYESLTGRAPFMSSSVVETVRMIVDDDPLPPRRLQPGIPRDLETICLHCLDKTPENRYASAQDLADDLRRFRQHEPILARRTSRCERAAKWCQRRPAHALLIALGGFSAFALLFGILFAGQVQRRRLETLRTDIAEQMRAGREAIERDELEVAQSHFQDAWIKVQAEPQLADHETSVTGWLDHTRNLANRYHWKQRNPPREFDERRDAALLQSLLVIPDQQQPISVARAAIRHAFEFTLPFNRSWQMEREQLTLLDSELVETAEGPVVALRNLDASHEFSSHAFHTRRAELLKQLNREAEAASAREQADEHPLRKTFERFHAGMRHLRQRELPAALLAFEEVLRVEPEHFAARLFQGITFLAMDRPSEACIALTACIAQRPRFIENYYFRALAHRSLHDFLAAKNDLDDVLVDRHAESVRYAAQLEWGRWELLDGHLKESASRFSQATTEQPEEPSAWRHLGWTQLIACDFPAAKGSFERILRDDSTDWEAQFGTALAAAGEGDWHPFLEESRQLNERISADLQSHFLLRRDNRALSP